MLTCNQLDLQTPGSQPVIMPKNIPDHWLHLPPILYRFKVNSIDPSKTTGKFSKLSNSNWLVLKSTRSSITTLIIPIRYGALSLY